MKPETMYYILLIIGVICESIGDYLFRKSFVDNKRIWLVVGFSIYIIGSICWSLLLEYQNLSNAIVVFVILNAIVDLLIGFFILHEQLTTKQYFGIGLSLVALYLIEG